MTSASAPALPPVADDATAPLEWEAFCARRFPGRPRHDQEAITAYGVYRTAWIAAVFA